MKNDIELANLFASLTYWDTIGTDTQYRVLEEHNEVIIIFKESNSKADWKINLSFPKRPYKRMPTPFYVHGGFLKEWKKINDYFLRRVERINKPITIVGWSYGGALAALCYEDIWFNNPFKRGSLRLITFGSPRVVGVLNFRKVAHRWIGARLYSNSSDLVASLPPALFGFRHVMRLRKIGNKKTLLGFFKTSKYHQISDYIKNMETLHGSRT